MEINKTKTEIEITIPWKTDLGAKRTIRIYIYPNGQINSCAPGEMNNDGLSAFKDALTIAEILKRRGY